MEIITPITIDTSKRSAPPRITAKQGDRNTRVLHLTVTDGTQILRPEADTTIVLRCLKPDGHRTVTPCTLGDDGTVEAVLPEQALTAAGAVQADLAMVNADGQLLSTVVFCIVVEPSPIGGPSADEISLPGTDPQTPAVIRKSAGQTIPPVVSFVDDDGRLEAYTVLFPWLKANQVPYNFAIAAGAIGTNGLFTNADQLREMAAEPLVSFSCHCLKDTVMTDKTALEMDEIFRTWFSEMSRHQLLSDRTQTRTYMYCHGVYEDTTVRNVVSRYFRAGFTTEKGINTTPFDSFHMNRVGLFPSNGSFTLANAKAYVDQAAAQGGWLVFFTHCYYDAFDLEGLTELVSYIRQKEIPIAGVEDVLMQYGNLQDLGCFNKRKPGKPYQVTDYLGNAYCDQGPVQFDFDGSGQTEPPVDPVDPTQPEPDEQWAALTVTPVMSQQLALETSSIAGLPAASASENACVTEPVSVAGLTRVRLVGNAITGHGKYSFLDKDGRLVLGNWCTVDTVAAQGNFDEEAAVPQGAVSVLISGSALRQMPAAYRLRTETPLQPDTPTEPDQPEQPESDKWVAYSLTTQSNRVIAKVTASNAGLMISPSSSSDNQFVCDPAPVPPGTRLRICGHAIAGFGKYSFLNEDGNLVQGAWSDPAASGVGGNFDEEAVMPEQASFVIIAGNQMAGRNMPQLYLFRSPEGGGEAVLD